MGAQTRYEEGIKSGKPSREKIRATFCGERMETGLDCDGQIDLFLLIEI